MYFSKNFFRIVINRDFDPIPGEKTRAQHYFQCKLPIWGSWLLLFILCLIGIICLGIHGGIKHHLNKIEKNPFASALRIEGSFSRAKLLALKEQLYFNVSNHSLEVSKQKKSDLIPVIKAVYPFNQIGLRFINTNGKSLLKHTHDVLSVKVQDNENNQDKTDIFMKEWISNSLLKEDLYFESEDLSEKNGIIISSSLFEKIGYKDFDEKKSQNISFLAVSKGTNMLEKRAEKGQELFKELSETEKIKHVVSVPLVNVADHLPGGDAIITEKFYQLLTRSNFYDPCKSIEHFYIYFTDSYDVTVKNKIKEWALNSFGHSYIRELYFSPNKSFVKIRFSNLSFNRKYADTCSKCNVKIKFNQLLKIVNNKMILDFKEDIPIYEENSDMYYYAFLYINKNQHILENIQKLTYFLKNKFGSYIEDHQVMTLKKYRNDMKKMNWIMFGVVISISVLIILYITVTFSLFLQTKIHNIGMMMSLGASSSIILLIYLFEALKLLAGPIVLSLLFGIFCSFFKYFYNDFIYSLSIFYIIIFIFFVVISAICGAWLAARHIVSQSPYQLISYKA